MIKVGCIGAGYWGKNLVRNFNNIGCLSAVCDGSDEILAKVEADYPEVEIFSDVDALLATNVDAVAIATPAETHFELIKKSLRAGKHVYVEKPLCLSEAHASEVIQLSDELGKTLMVGHLLWYHPAVLEIKSLVDAGSIGQLRYVYSNRLNIGLLRNEEDVLWSFAPHDISMILGIVGREPTKVASVGASYITEGVADYSICHMDFGEGVKGHVFVSWLNPFKEQKLVVVGETGMLVFDDTLDWESKLTRYDHSVDLEGDRPFAVKGEPSPIPLSPMEPLREECIHFVNSIEKGSVPRTDGREGLSVLKVLNMASQFADKNDTIYS